MKMLNTMLITLLVIGSPSATSQTNSQYNEALQLIDVWLTAKKDYQNIPAIMAVVVDDQDILYSGAFGYANKSKALKASENTITSICSTSKVFTATAIMKLVDEGKLSLDDKVRDILPDFKVHQAPTEGSAITIRSLLSHTSGLPRDTKHGYWSGPDFAFPTKDEMYESLASQHTTYAVGANMSYSNTGYALLGPIIEKVSGQSYSNYMQQSIFKPLGMTNSVVEMQSSTYGNQHAMGYSAINRDGKRKVANFYQTRAMQPAAGISTTANDLAKFAMWQFRLADESKPELMKSSTLKSMYEVQASSKNGRAKRGFGYEVYTDKNNHQWAMHGGICPGYVSYFKMDVTNKRAYTVLVNANRIRAAAIIKGLAKILNHAESIDPQVKPKVDLSSYTGFYNLNPWNSEYYVGPWGDGLVLLYLPAKSLEYSLYFYRHVENDTFQLLENGQLSDAKINFIRDKSGKVVQVRNEGNYHSRIVSH